MALPDQWQDLRVATEEELIDQIGIATESDSRYLAALGDAVKRMLFRCSGHPEPERCWVPAVALQSTGYAAIKVAGAKRDCHRVMFQWSRRLVTREHDVGHLCGQRACVNPQHLVARTRSETVANAKRPCPRSAPRRR